MSRGIEGRCHVCRQPQLVKWCPKCRHWMCDGCRSNIPARILSALFAAFADRDDCCGPFVRVS